LIKEAAMAHLEHANITVTNPEATAALLCTLFDWRIRWQGPAMQTGRVVHVGTDNSYVALFSYGNPAGPRDDSYRTRAALNHIGVVVEDIEAVEAKVKAAGYVPGNHAHYEPGRRFYFTEANGVEIEVVSYT
jgi:predicted enzyme related to lactoylglutathione lyase